MKTKRTKNQGKHAKTKPNHTSRSWNTMAESPSTRLATSKEFDSSIGQLAQPLQPLPRLENQRGFVPVILMPHHHAPSHTGTGRRAHPCRCLHLWRLPLSATAHQRLCFIYRRSSLRVSSTIPQAPDRPRESHSTPQTNAELVQFRDSLRLEGVACCIDAAKRHFVKGQF